MLTTIEPVPPTCPECGTEMVLRTKGEDKFYGCPNYKECGAKTISYGRNKKEKPEVRRPEQSTADQIILEEIQGLRKGFDDMKEDVAEKMANLKKILVIISEKK